MILVAAAGPVPAHVDVARGHLPGRGRVVMVGQTQRYVIFVQEIEDGVFVPALVTELEGEAITARQHVEEGRQPLAVLRELRRKLEQDCADFWRPGFKPGLHQRDRVWACLAQSLPMGDELRGLPGE